MSTYPYFTSIRLAIYTSTFTHSLFIMFTVCVLETHIGYSTLQTYDTTQYKNKYDTNTMRRNYETVTLQNSNVTNTVPPANDARRAAAHRTRVPGEVLRVERPGDHASARILVHAQGGLEAGKPASRPAGRGGNEEARVLDRRPSPGVEDRAHGASWNGERRVDPPRPGRSRCPVRRSAPRHPTKSGSHEALRRRPRTSRRFRVTVGPGLPRGPAVRCARPKAHRNLRARPEADRRPGRCPDPGRRAASDCRSVRGRAGRCPSRA